MREIMLKEAVELMLPAQQNMMLVLRLTTAGVIARAGLTVDRMDDVKLAVEEACSCLIGAENGPSRLHLCFRGDEGGLKIIIGGDCSEEGAAVGEDEIQVVRCILESLVDGVELGLCSKGAIRSIELIVRLGE